MQIVSYSDTDCNSQVSGSAGSSLGIYTKNLSTASQSVEYSRSEALLSRFALQSAARSMLPRERVAWCLRRPVSFQSVLSTEIDTGEQVRKVEQVTQCVSVLYAPDKAAAHFGGLMTCASVWHCPVCASKISERRREDLSLGVTSWLDCSSAARRVLLVTFTLRHNAGQALSVVLGCLRRARQLILSGRWFSSFGRSAAVAGQVRALEVTYGASGWHPHLHVLFFLEDEPNLARFTHELKVRWMQCVAAAGGSADYDHGVDVKVARSDIADYVAKFGHEPKWSVSHEVAKAAAKKAGSGGDTPLQLLERYLYGDMAAGRRWLEYAVNFKGQRQLFWSQKLRDTLGLNDEVSDEVLSDEQSEIAVLLAQLNYKQWHIVLMNDARADLLNVAASGDSEAVWSFLSSIGVDNYKEV